MQNSSYTLLRRYSSGVLHEAASQSILMVDTNKLAGLVCG